MAHGEHPIEVAVEHRVAASAGKTRQRRHDHLALLGELVEERNPTRQTAEAREKSKLVATPLSPDAAREAVDLDGRDGRFGHMRLGLIVSGGAGLWPERRHGRAELLLHRLRPPAVLPFRE